MKRWISLNAHNIALWFGGLALVAAVVITMASGGEMSDEAKACRLLDVAMQEAEMSEGWYIEAGKALERCGIKEARAEAERKACFARRRNEATINCE